MNKSVFGLSENVAAALAYLLGFITGIVVLVMEKENKVVRFAALQSTVFFAVIFLVTSILGMLSRLFLVGWLFSVVGSLIGIVVGITWLVLILTALVGKPIKLPIVGDISWEQAHK